MFYSDTDSFCICSTGDLDNLVKESHRKRWKKEKKNWFVLDENDPEDLRMPGKFKLEWQTSNGAFIA